MTRTIMVRVMVRVGVRVKGRVRARTTIRVRVRTPPILLLVTMCGYVIEVQSSVGRYGQRQC